jgi:uncharacterized membrane protein YccC
MLTKIRSLMLAKDPGRRALRRGARVAIVVPVTLAVLLQIPYVKQGALMGAFASLALLVFSDFGGPLRQRFTAYLVTTLAGVPLVFLGAFAGQSRWTAVLTMAVVALIVAVMAVLRGVVAAAQSVLLLATVLALTASTPAVVVPDVICWVIGGLIAGLSAVLLWPAHQYQPIRGCVADVLDAVATASEIRWIEAGAADRLQPARQQVNEAITTLHAKYDGNLLRPSGVTSADRALAVLVDETSRLRYLQHWQDVSEHKDPEVAAMTARLTRVVVAGLRRAAARLRGGSDPLSSQALFDIRGVNLDEMADWLQRNRDAHEAGYLREQIEDTFPVRITTLIACRITDQTIAVSGRPGDEYAEPPARPALGPVRTPTGMDRIRAHLSWSSPWLRNAVRTAVALSLSVAVAKSVSLQHPFWIVLGTLSALRFDALGTGRTARQALAGTTAGVLLSALCIELVGDNTAVWWALFPLALFWAAYTPGTLSFAVGQAGFSFVVIVMFSIMSPVRLDTATARFVDVLLGLAISLLVSLLMWPRGVIETLYSRLREAMAAACDFYVAATDWMAGGAIDDQRLADYRQRSNDALDRAEEALDLSIAQRPPKAVALEKWTSLANTVEHVDFAARLMPQAEQVVAMRGDQTPIPAPLIGPLLQGTDNARSQLMQATDHWCTLQPAFSSDQSAAAFSGEIPGFTTAPSVSQLRHSIDELLSAPSDWGGSGSDPRPVIVTWLTDWTALFDRTAQVLELPPRTTSEP